MSSTTSPQQCSSPGCENPAAYATRTKPAWWTPCIDDIFRTGGSLDSLTTAGSSTL